MTPNRCLSCKSYFLPLSVWHHPMFLMWRVLSRLIFCLIPEMDGFVTCSMWRPFVVETKCIPQRMPFTTDVLDVSCFLCQSKWPPKWMPSWQMFSMTDVLNVSLQHAPDMDVSNDRGCQCETISCRTKCPRNGCLSRQMFSMRHSFFVEAKCTRNGCLLWQMFSMWSPCLL